MSSNITEGSIVIFDVKVYGYPYSPYYDAYKDHIFEVIGLYTERDSICIHAELKCISDPLVIVQGYVHLDEIQIFEEV